VVIASTPVRAVPALTEAEAWNALAQVLDPELPVLSVLDLGIVRAVDVGHAGVRVTVTPTYSGCPATEVIQDMIRAALLEAGAGAVCVELQYAPPWTTDWITPDGADRLRRHGIAPPHAVDASARAEAQALRFHPRCPRCTGARSEQLAAFGSTPCKALYRCLACREPFEFVKPI
jgi:ring-1,2-phenylacetyl-CoA epoxidase subunit PaaD